MKAIFLVVYSGWYGCVGAPLFALAAQWLATGGKLNWYASLALAVVCELLAIVILQQFVSISLVDNFGRMEVLALTIGAFFGPLLRWGAYSLAKNQD